MKTTKDQLLTLGQSLIQQHGYFGFSYYQLAEQLNIKHAAVHYHFKRKEDLGRAIIRKNIVEVEQAFEEWNHLGDWERIDAFMSIYRPSNDTKRICIIGALGADFLHLSNELKAELQQLIQQLWDWLTKILAEGKKNGSFYFQSDARTKAMLMCTNMMAGLQFARILGPEKFEQICETLIQELKPS